jgi:site-specific DNA-methyltransferase (adenine-specific)
MQVKDLKQDHRNYRKHNERNLDLIKKSINEVGLGRSIVIDSENEIVCGNGLVSQLDKNTPVKVIETDGSELVVVKRTDLNTNDEKRKKLAVMDNSTSDSSEFDLELLSVDFEVPELKDMGIDVPDVEIEEKEVVEDEVPEEVETRCKRGDIWKLGVHRLMCGDSTCTTDVEKLMDGQKADLLFTDPPYGVSYEKKTKEVLKSKSYTKIQNDDLTLDQFQDFLYDVFTNAFSCLKDTASYYVFSCQGGDQEMMMMMMMRQAGIPCRHQIIWVKDAPVFSMGRLDYDYKHEPILYGWVKKHDFQRKGEQDKSVWEYKRTANKLHPTMKPVELIANALLNSTKNEENVLDLFGGSGSTLIACEQLNRKCFVMELDEHYCDVIIQRWENLTGKTAEREYENN